MRSHLKPNPVPMPLQGPGDDLSGVRAELKANALAALPQTLSLRRAAHAIIDVLVDKGLVEEPGGGLTLQFLHVNSLGSQVGTLLKQRGCASSIRGKLNLVLDEMELLLEVVYDSEGHRSMVSLDLGVVDPEGLLLGDIDEGLLLGDDDAAPAQPVLPPAAAAAAAAATAALARPLPAPAPAPAAARPAAVPAPVPLAPAAGAAAAPQPLCESSDDEPAAAVAVPRPLPWKPLLGVECSLVTTLEAAKEAVTWLRLFRKVAMDTQVRGSAWHGPVYLLVLTGLCYARLMKSPCALLLLALSLQLLPSGASPHPDLFLLPRQRARWRAAARWMWCSCLPTGGRSSLTCTVCEQGGWEGVFLA